MREKGYIIKTVYFYPEDLKRLEEIAEKIGAKSISEAIRIMIRNAEIVDEENVAVKLIAKSLA